MSASAWTQAQPFVGLPLVGDATPHADVRWTFAILGDKTSGGEGKWPIYDRAVDVINLLEPDFVITVGDQIPGHMQERPQWDAEWREYLEHARRLRAPLLLTVGNHDIANVECHRFWKEDFGPTYYAFDHKGCHFLVLNTEEERIDGRGPVWEAMMAFAEKDLAEHRDSRHTFVFFHKPMWDDPRYTEDWARLEKALAGRKYTVVAGHEHYLMTERRGDGLLVIQSGTGAGINLSNVKEFGGFHSFGYVTVDGDDTTYAVIEPEGGIWPVDVAPASFRKAIGFEILQLDADPPEIGPDAAVVRARARFHNVLTKPITVELTVGALDACAWQPELPSSDGRLVLTETLEPGQQTERPLVFRTTPSHLHFPPPVTWRVQYEGEWIEYQAEPMTQERVVPMYPVSCLRSVSEWQLIGPFPIGDIDTAALPGDPAAANAKFVERLGPEDGFDASREYDGGRKWFAGRSQGRGLLNLNALMGTLDHAAGYALCGVQSAEDQLVHVIAYADNYVQVLLNGEFVDGGQSFGAPGGFVYAPLHLHAGWNTLVIKVVNNRGDWFTRVLIADPNGNLRFGPAPPATGE